METPTIEWSEEGRIPLFAAYAKAQAAMGEVKKNQTNPAFKNKYADLSTVLDAVLPAMNANGLAVIQSPSFDGEWLILETYVIHVEGGWFRSSIKLRPSKTDPQGVGSAITYARRYAAQSLTGVAPEDDDGNAASGPQERGDRDRFVARDTYVSPSPVVVASRAAIELLNSPEECADWWKKNKAGLDGTSKAEVDAIIGHLSARKKATMPFTAATREETDFRDGGPEGVARNGHHAALNRSATPFDDEIPTTRSPDP
jgi:hypothetical protein